MIVLSANACTTATQAYLGSALARLESQAALQALSNRLPTMRIAAGHRLHYRPNNNLRILTDLPVKW